MPRVERFDCRASVRHLQPNRTSRNLERGDEPVSERGSFDSAAFYAALDAVRDSRELNWRQVAAESGISPSTLTRLAQGKRPDVDSLAALVDWGGLKADDYVQRVHAEVNGEPLAMISTYLRADKSLSPEIAEALEGVLQATYKALSKGKDA